MTNARSEPLKVVYLGISGVLHPSRSLYELLEGRSPEHDGHRPYEAVPALEDALQRWPEARIVLTSTLPWSNGMPAVLDELGPGLAGRVIGYTHEDLTKKLRRGSRHRPLSNEDYWRCLKCEIVRMHVDWLKPTAWIAIDDESILWTEKERQQHFAEVDGCRGLLDPAAMDRLVTLLEGNFGW